MSYDLGDAVALTATARDAAGDPANATGATLTVTMPDGSTASPEVTNPPATTGTYSAEYVPTMPGLHAVRWIFTGPASAHVDVFNVRPAIPRQIVSLADAKLALRKKGSVDDEELRGVIAAATSEIERVVGPVLRRTVTERHQGGAALALNVTPVLEVTSLTYASDGSTAYPVSDLDVDLDAGIVRARLGSLPGGCLVVDYVAGRLEVDEAILEAAKIVVEHLWETRRGHSGRPGMFGQQAEAPSTEQQTFAFYSGFVMPHRAAELLAPFARVDGFA